MKLLPTLLLSAYYWGNLPARRRRARRRAQLGTAPVMVLMYHRVADDRATPWTISNRAFARQIEWLSRNFETVSLDEAQRRLEGFNGRPCVSVTFDDGYADNCIRALPLLLEKRIPLTYFVTTRPVIEARPFLHDLARGVAPPPNTVEQLRALAAAGVEIGAHTRTHADLGATRDPGRLWNELVGSVEELAALVDRPIRWFAFPFGQRENLSAAAAAIARAVGLSGVCSAYGGYNFPGDDPFHLQRIAVDEDLLRLKNWLTVDMRKLRKHPRYEFPPVTAPARRVALDPDKQPA
jgi:peptidoglycan/xylan/chitin deacetylase (PgdA/CDA1 family)